MQNVCSGCADVYTDSRQPKKYAKENFGVSFIKEKIALRRDFR